MFNHTLLRRWLFWPIAERIQKTSVIKDFKFLKSVEWCSEEELIRLQNNRLQKLIAHCYANVPYYTKLFDKLDLTPNDIRCKADLQKLPVLTKQIIRDNYQEFIAKDIKSRKSIHVLSGGSTGVPLKFMSDTFAWGKKWSSSFRAWNGNGFKYGGKIFTFGGNSLVKTKSERWRITKKDIFDRLIMNNIKVDCSDLSNEALLRAYKKMMRVKPKIVRGYPASIYSLAKYVDQNNLPIPKIQMVCTTGEILLPIHRNTIQRVFHVPVYDNYGAGDGGIMSYECYMHEGLHIAEEECVVEIADDKGNVVNDGCSGFVITTDLNNYVFPFIRYQVGDMAVIKPEKCSCGRKTRLINQVIGRTGKTLFSKQGKPFTSIIIDNMMFKNMDYHRPEHEALYQRMEQFQVRQDKDGDITILIKPVDKNEPITTFDYVKDNFLNNFPDSCIEIKFVDNIPKMSSGKEEYCVSEYNYGL